jgi:mannose-6-phosphate isomerase
LWRLEGAVSFTVGAVDTPRILLCADGTGNVEYDGADFVMERGAVVFLSAAVGACRFRPDGAVTLLDIRVPDDR